MAITVDFLGNRLVTDGINIQQSVANVSTHPTAAELTAIFGSPTTLGRGFVGSVDDNSGDTAVYVCITSDASWYWTLCTKST